MVSQYEIQEFFFEGVSLGWAGDGEYTRVPGLPRHKEFVHRSENGKLWIVDRYCTVPNSRKSSGTTTIFSSEGGDDEVPVWVMHYGGEYSEEVIPLVKFACSQAYSVKKFHGGRGNHTVRIEGRDQFYTNEYEGDFSRFAGSERVGDSITLYKFGYHYYFGMLLV